VTEAPLLSDYLDNTTPWAKQQEAFAAALDEATNSFYPLFALFMEQRTGKAIVTIGLAAYKYERGEIDALLVVASPAGVPANWRDEIEGTPNAMPPRRLPDWVKRMTVVWDCGRAEQARYKQNLETLLGFKGLSILLVPGEAVSTDNWRRYAARFVRRRRTLAVVDESSLVMARAGNKRAKILRGLAHHTQHRLVLDGTPAGESPLAMYPQMAFLSTAILGADNSALFKAKYTNTLTVTRRDGRAYPALDPEAPYKNLDEMAARLTPISFRCRRTECYDIPPKQYQPYHFDLSAEQRRVYASMESTYEAELRDGTLVSAAMVLTRYLRFQQIASNYWPSEIELTLCPDCRGHGCEACDGLGGVPSRTPPRVIDPKSDPRLTAYEDVLTLNPAPLITWARFDADVDKCMAAALRLNRRPVRYDGKVTKDQKYLNLRAFQGGIADVIVAKQSSMQRGVNAGAALAHVFYSNTFSGIQRQQSEDRTEVAGRTAGTAIIDLIARATKDEDIVLAHVSKLSLSETIMKRRTTHV
jgi:hypothetical protein